MNKNTLIGFVLIGAIMIGFGWYNSKQIEQQQRYQAQQDSIARANAPQPVIPQMESVISQAADDTLQKEIEIENLGEQLASALTGAEQFYTVENNLLAVTFSNKGGRIYSVLLKNFQSYEKEPIVLFSGNENRFSLEFFTKQRVSTGDFYFDPIIIPAAAGIDENNAEAQLAMRLQVDSTSWIDYTYTLRHNSYMLDFSMKMVGMNKHIPQNVNSMDLTWEVDLKAQEKGFENESNFSTVNYKYPNTGDIEGLNMRKPEGSEKINARVSWIAFKQQFFSSVILAENLLQGADIAYKNYKADDPDKKLMHCSANMQLTYSNKPEEEIPFQFYFGPNHYKVLKMHGHDMEKMIPLGSIWIDKWINRLIIIPTFDFLSRFIGSYGLIILLLTILIKVILLPLTHRSHISTAKMRVLKPEIDKINAKYPKQEDALKKQQETMALYKRTGVSMMGGCLPMLLQMPILFAMFRFFPSSFELRQEGFLWADDLSGFDSILNLPFDIPFYGDHVSGFGLLMAISMFFYSRTTMSQQPAAGQMPGMKFMQLYFMPVFMLFLFNNFSSGLNYYYMLSNFITIGQTWVTRKWLVDEAELLRKMKERAAQQQPQKKSNFQQRLEDLQKKQQQQRLQQQQQRSKKK